MYIFIFCRPRKYVRLVGTTGHPAEKEKHKNLQLFD